MQPGLESPAITRPPSLQSRRQGSDPEARPGQDPRDAGQTGPDMDSVVRIGAPVFADDTVTFGILMAVLGMIFYATIMTRFKRFFSLIPALLLCYFVPSVLTTLGLISPGWFDLAGATEFMEEAIRTSPNAEPICAAWRVAMR